MRHATTKKLYYGRALLGLHGWQHSLPLVWFGLVYNTWHFLSAPLGRNKTGESVWAHSGHCPDREAVDPATGLLGGAKDRPFQPIGRSLSAFPSGQILRAGASFLFLPEMPRPLYESWQQELVLLGQPVVRCQQDESWMDRS